MNLFALFCIIYVLMLLINGVILGTLSNISYISIQHLISNAILCGVPMVVLLLIRRVPFLSRFNDDDCSPWVSVPVHFVLSCVLLLLAGFALTVIRSEPVPFGEYLRMLGTFAQGYIVVVIAAAVIEILKIESVNKNLKKIQENQNKKTGGVLSE
jgi:hypothetical protein